MRKIKIYSLIGLMIMASCLRNEKNILKQMQYSNVTLNEDNIVLSGFPNKLVYGSDSTLYFINQNHIIAVNPINGTLKQVLNTDSLNANSILNLYYKIDTSQYSKLIEENHLSTIQPKLELANFDKLNSDTLLLIFNINYPNIHIKNNEDTNVLVELNCERGLLFFDLQKNNFLIKPITLFNDTNKMIGDIPESGFFTYKNNLFIGRNCFGNNNTRYSILSCYDIESLLLKPDIPIYITKSKESEIIKNKVEIIHNYISVMRNDVLYTDNDYSIFDLSSQKALLNLKPFIKGNFYINYSFPMSKDSWFIEILTAKDKSLYLYRKNQLQLIQSNYSNSTWLCHPTKNIFYCLKKDSLNYKIITYEF